MCPTCGNELDMYGVCQECGWYEGREMEPLDEVDLSLLHAHPVIVVGKDA